jgi:death-on-curing protein
MRYLSLPEVVYLHDRLLATSGGGAGLRDMAALASALAQPKATFGGEELHPTLIEKAAALCFSLVQNHAFIDGNKRIGHAAMEVFLALNGHALVAGIDEQERLVLSLASGQLPRAELVAWLGGHVRPAQ